MKTISRYGEAFEVEDGCCGWGDYWDLYASGAWEPRSFDLIDQYITPGKIYIDIGAWIGPLTLWAVRRGGFVVAIEPDPVAFGALVDNISANQMSNQTQVRRGAVVSSQQPPLYLIPAPTGEFGDSLSRISTSQDTVGVEVQQITFAQLLAIHSPSNIGLVKIDVEGYELDLLPTVAPLLAAEGIPLQVAIHGQRPPDSCFEGYSSVEDVWVYEGENGPWGDLVARP